MSDRSDPQTAAAAAREDPEEARLRALYAAAYVPVKPSEGLRRRVATLTAPHEAPAAQHRGVRPARPIGWAPVAVLSSAVLLTVIGLMLVSGSGHGTRRYELPRTAQQTLSGLRALPSSPARRPAATDHAHDRAPSPPVSSRGADESAAPAALRPAARDGRGPGSDPKPIPDGRPGRQVPDGPLRVTDAPAVAAIRWPTVSRQEQIEARLRHEVPIRDDFVHIPFPRLADASGRQIAAAVESYKREAGVVDPRLAREVTLQQKATALSDLCERLRGDTGIQLGAGPSVADEKVTLFCAKLPLREVMRQLSRPFGYTWLRSRLPARAPTRGTPTGLPAKAGPAVAESLLYDGSDVAGYVGAIVEKPGAESRSEAAYRYELVQDLRSQLLEEELRNRDRNAALLALDRELERFRPYLRLPPEEVRARAATAAPEEKRLLERLIGHGWGAVQMYFRLSPRDQAALRAGHRLLFSAAPAPDEQPLPTDLAPQVLRSLSDGRMRIRDGGFVPPEETDSPDGLLPASTPEAGALVTLRLDHSELGQTTLEGGSGVRLATGGSQTMTSAGLAVGMSPSARDPENGATNAGLAPDPALRPRVTVQPKSSCVPDLPPTPSPKRGGVPGSRYGTPHPEGAERHDRRGAEDKLPLPASGRGSGGEVNPPKATTADVLEALHRACGLPIVADYYTRIYTLPAVSAHNMPLFEALNRLADTMRLRWSKDGKWLQFRSANYYDDRLKEVPNRLLSRWVASRRQHGVLTLDDLLEIIQLSDAQLDSSIGHEAARDCLGLPEWDLVHYKDQRPHLRYLASLTPAQRQMTLTPGGLPFARMSLAQQQQFLALGVGSRRNQLPSLEDLAGAALRCQYTQPGGFEWNVPSQVAERLGRGTIELSPVWEPTREAALRAARRFDPAVEPEQIAQTELAVSVLYTWGEPKTRVTPLLMRATPNYTRLQDGGSTLDERGPPDRASR